MQEQALASMLEKSAEAARAAAREVMQQQSTPVAESGHTHTQQAIALHDVPGRSSPAPSCSETPSIESSSASLTMNRQSLERQLLELQAQQAYDMEQMRQRDASRNAEITRLQYLMRNS